MIGFEDSIISRGEEQVSMQVYLVGLVGENDGSVEVGVDISLGPDLTLDEVVLALVVHDEVHPLGRAAHVRAEHDAVKDGKNELNFHRIRLRQCSARSVCEVERRRGAGFYVLVLGLALELLLVKRARADLDVGTTAILGLLVLDGVLDHEGLVLVGELGEGGRQLVEPGILRGLDALVLLGVVEVLAGGVRELASVARGIIVGGVHPSALPRVCVEEVEEESSEASSAVTNAIAISSSAPKSHTLVRWDGKSRTIKVLLEVNSGRGEGQKAKERKSEKGGLHLELLRAK